MDGMTSNSALLDLPKKTKEGRKKGVMGNDQDFFVFFRFFRLSVY
jgi:hypothetical protein